MSRYLDWLLLAIVVLVSLASPLIVLEFVGGRYWSRYGTQAIVSVRAGFFL